MFNINFIVTIPFFILSFTCTPYSLFLCEWKSRYLYSFTFYIAVPSQTHISLLSLPLPFLIIIIFHFSVPSIRSILVRYVCNLFIVVVISLSGFATTARSSVYAMCSILFSLLSFPLPIPLLGIDLGLLCRRRTMLGFFRSLSLLVIFPCILPLLFLLYDYLLLLP